MQKACHCGDANCGVLPVNQEIEAAAKFPMELSPRESVGVVVLMHMRDASASFHSPGKEIVHAHCERSHDGHPCV
jgi:hypothetical protein